MTYKNNNNIVGPVYGCSLNGVYINTMLKILIEANIGNSILKQIFCCSCNCLLGAYVWMWIWNLKETLFQRGQKQIPKFKNHTVCCNNV